MTPKEFKAWFEGFTEALDGTPSKTQWARIKERVAEIDGTPITQTVYLDRYYPRYPSYPYYPWWTTTGLGSQYQGLSNQYQSALKNFNSCDAMYATGKSDALSLGATNGT